MRKALDSLYNAAGYLAAFFVFAIFAVMIASTIMRTIGMRTGGTDDIVSWMTAAASFFALAHTFKHGDFVRVTLFLDSMAPVRRHAFEVATLTIGSLFTAYITWAVCLAVLDSWRFNDIGTGLIVLPLWIPQMSFVFGSLLLTIAVIDEWIIVLRGGKPTYVLAVEERHARGDFSEDI